MLSNPSGVKLMKQISEIARKLPVLEETEVLVVGSGPGGLSAAIAAATNN